MQAGNRWQYAFQNEFVSEETVTKDSATNENSVLYWVNNFPFYLVDSNYTVYGWHPSGQLQYMDCYFKLDAELGDEWFVWRNLYDSTSGIIRKVEGVYEGVYLGHQTIFKEIVEY